MNEAIARETLLALTADIVSAHVSYNPVGVADLPAPISSIHRTVAALGQAAPDAQDGAPTPAVSIRSSVKRDHIVCLERGAKMKMLKRHLATDHRLTPSDYRSRWKLAGDYPLVAPDYAEKRKELAKKIGFARKPRGTTVLPPDVQVSGNGVPKKRVRRKLSVKTTA